MKDIIKKQVWWKRLLGIGLKEETNLVTLAVRTGMCTQEEEGLILSRRFVQFLIEQHDEIEDLVNRRTSDGRWLPIPDSPRLPLSCIAPIIIWLRKTETQVTAKESVLLASLYRKFSLNLLARVHKRGKEP